MKSLGSLSAAISMALALTILVVPPITEAKANQGLKNRCEWYRKQAMIAGRKGKTKQAEANWEKYRQCIRGWL